VIPAYRVLRVESMRPRSPRMVIDSLVAIEDATYP
jgi:hypothetical protein